MDSQENHNTGGLGAEAVNNLNLKQAEELLNTVGWNDHEDYNTAYKSIFDSVDSDDDNEDSGAATTSETQTFDCDKIGEDDDEALFGTEFCAVERSADRSVVQLTDPHSGLSLRISRTLLDQWNDEQARLQSGGENKADSHNCDVSHADHADKAAVDVP